MDAGQAAIAETLSEGPVKLTPGARLQAIDILRGLVIIIMVLDHVRDYMHATGYAYGPLDFHRTTPLIYATRWITHLCAPTFVFLAGVSAWLQFVKGKGTPSLSRFLLTRGLWLVVLEFTVVSFGWAFSIPYFALLGTIWAIGWSMVILSGLVWLPRKWVLAIGGLIVVGHNLLDGISVEAAGPFGTLWMYLHAGGTVYWGNRPIADALFPILPWAGLMAVGYGLGPVFLSPQRDRYLIMLGTGMIAAFVVLRGFNIYGDPRHWAVQAQFGHSLMDFFNVQKYPPSLLYVCATIGPVCLAFPWLDRIKGVVPDFLRTFGAVPMMAYLAHIYIMHTLAIFIHLAAGQSLGGMFNTINHMFFTPEAFGTSGFDIWVVYALWATVVALVYPLCVWWGGVKKRRRDWWLSYL